MEARLPQDKLVYLTNLLDSWSSRSACRLKELQQLIGFLQFASQVIPHSRAFLHRLITFSCSFKNDFTRRRLSIAAQREIHWWKVFAQHWNGIRLIRPTYPTIHVYTDASGTKGLGGIFQNFWFSTRIPRRFRARDIQFKELYAVLQAILRWGHHWQHHHVVFHIDNQAVVFAMQSDSNRSAPLMSVLRVIIMLAAALEFSYFSSWLPSADNAIADCASRFLYKKLFDVAPNLNKQPCSPHPRTSGIKRMLTSHAAQRSGSGTDSRLAREQHTEPVFDLSSTFCSYTLPTSMGPGILCPPPQRHLSSGLPS